MSEKELVEQFKQYVESTHPHWQVKTEIPIGSLRADARIDEVDQNGVVRAIIAYVEAKDGTSDLKELLSGYADALYYSEQSGSHGWLAIPGESVKKVLDSGKKLDPRVEIYNLDTHELIQVESVTDKMGKSRMKRKMESTLFQGWSHDYTIETEGPIGVTVPQYADDKETVLFNLGQRVRGCLKEVSKTISGTLSDSVKYSVYVEPAIIEICKKSELTMITKYVPDKKGGSAKRELYEVPAGKRFTFTVRCINQKFTPQIMENLLRQGGQFAGIGDSHSDGLHGRFHLVQE